MSSPAGIPGEWDEASRVLPVHRAAQAVNSLGRLVPRLIERSAVAFTEEDIFAVTPLISRNNARPVQELRTTIGGIHKVAGSVTAA
jgi:hypothetical protein